ncbi:hypothetical protein CYMTET_7790 [Cymbomonas tetramitiformis]|uniref:Uncharacterized protein n=1 Tax=Cymbomonas tetramitiformis TaxID=36881 RepID=A0AAE0LGQ7_9CHLO|nr:hypothetical protein CYMTET_7790 [Cymbomonas tetramitiformis]
MRDVLRSKSIRESTIVVGVVEFGDHLEVIQVATREGNVVGKLVDGEGDEEGGGFLLEEAVFRGDTEGVSGACRPVGEGREESLLNKSEGLMEQGVNICRIKTGSGSPGVEASADRREEVREGEGN